MAMSDGGSITDADGQVNISGTMETYDLTNGNDTFVDESSQPDMTVVGGQGDDTYSLDPGSTITVIEEGGIDKVDFANSPQSISVNMAEGTAFDADGTVIFRDGQGNPGGVEEIVGTAGDDILIGSHGDDRLEGLGGNDVLIGGDGNDSLDGGSGDDVSDGGSGDDVYLITPGSDDIIFDSGGVDELDFSAASLGVAIDLTLTNGQFQQVDFAGNRVALNGVIENVVGSEFDDHITGNSSNNRLIGLTGNDKLTGASGDDILLGGAGDDNLVGSSGRDLLIGGDGADRIVGSSGDDLLIAGVFSFDSDRDSFSEEELMLLDQVFAEWTRTDLSFHERVDMVLDLLLGSVFDDDGDNDTMTGSGGEDLYFKGPGDKITGNTKQDEIVNL